MTSILILIIKKVPMYIALQDCAVLLPQTSILQKQENMVVLGIAISLSNYTLIF